MRPVKIIFVVFTIIVMASGTTALPDAAVLDNVVFYGSHADFLEDGEYVSVAVSSGKLGVLVVNVSIPDNGTGIMLYERSSDGFKTLTNRERITLSSGTETYLLPADQRGDEYRLKVELPKNSTLYSVEEKKTFLNIRSSESVVPRGVIWFVVGFLAVVMFLKWWYGREKDNLFKQASQAKSVSDT